VVGVEFLGCGERPAFIHITTGAVIKDAKPSNGIRGRDGTVWPFDVVVESTGSLG
jgi:hypothetical protein